VARILDGAAVTAEAGIALLRAGGAPAADANRSAPGRDS
jgi:hypothetical protein